MTYLKFQIIFYLNQTHAKFTPRDFHKDERIIIWVLNSILVLKGHFSVQISHRQSNWNRNWIHHLPNFLWLDDVRGLYVHMEIYNRFFSTISLFFITYYVNSLIWIPFISLISSQRHFKIRNLISPNWFDSIALISSFLITSHSI